VGITTAPSQHPLLNEQSESHPAVYPAARFMANILGEGVGVFLKTKLVGKCRGRNSFYYWGHKRLSKDSSHWRMWSGWKYCFSYLFSYSVCAWRTVDKILVFFFFGGGWRDGLVVKSTNCLSTTLPPTPTPPWFTITSPTGQLQSKGDLTTSGFWGCYTL
jgi:hypothetical protein